MRKIFTLLSLIVVTVAQSRAQSNESHNFVTYDTVLHLREAVSLVGSKNIATRKYVHPRKIRIQHQGQCL